jgi:tyrosine decarboxylase / aspartate 1-decarboxylase
MILRKIKLRLVGLKHSLIDSFLYSVSDRDTTFLKRVFSVFGLFIFQDSKLLIGSLWSRPSITSWLLASFGLSYNINNLGNPFSKETNQYDFMQKIEREVISWNKEVINCRDENVEGYVTSGGTESNLFLMWSGREYLLKNSDKRPILIKSEFTHYSIQKSARILGLQVRTIGINRETWGLDIKLLEDEVERLVKQGFLSIMLPITIGYSSTGSSDDLREIVRTLKKLQKKYSKLNFFVWIDAAAQGLVKSFLDKNFKPFEDALIKGYVLDFHKLGQAPLPAGLVLYKKELRKLIETPIDYLHEQDATISGSRPGSSILSIWGSINSKSKESWQEYFLKLEHKKNAFVKRLKLIYPEVNIINEKKALTIAILIDDNFPKLSERIEEKFSLVECNVAGVRHYKIHVLK